MKDPRNEMNLGRRGLQASMTGQLVARQLFLLFLAGTALLFVCFFFDYYKGISFWSLWEDAYYVDFKIIQLPALLVAIYGYVGFSGILFTLGPSERNFRFFFGAMMVALGLTAYDHGTIDWLQLQALGVSAVNPNPVSAPKVLAAGALILVVAVMHYNILAEDFARRMLRRGVPIEEVAPIRRSMIQVLLPTMSTAVGIAFALALFGEFASFIFGSGGGLLPKLEFVLLAGLVVPIAFLIRGILRDLAKGRGDVEKEGPNR